MSIAYQNFSKLFGDLVRGEQAGDGATREATNESIVFVDKFGHFHTAQLSWTDSLVITATIRFAIASRDKNNVLDNDLLCRRNICKGHERLHPAQKLVIH